MKCSTTRRTARISTCKKTTNRLRAAAAIAAFAACALPLGAQPVQVPFGNDRLEAIGQRYFAELWRLDPVRATREGVHDYDCLLYTSPSPRD